jgi:hypothetical protein
MACSITIYKVNGVVPAGGTQPTSLRVMGLAVDCPGGVIVSSTSPPGLVGTTAPAIPNGDGRFLIDVPLTTVINCGDQLALIVACQATPACFDTWTARPLACCEVQFVSVGGVVPQGQLTPTAINVTGTLYGCASDQVTISVPSAPAIIPQTLPVDPVLGGFGTTLPIPAGTVLSCGANIVVTAACVGGCTVQYTKPLDCPQCFRAVVSASLGPCSGVAPNQTRPVTLTAQIGLPGNGSASFAWAFGGGTPLVGPPFTVTNTGGQSATITHVEPPHNYPVGNFVAELRRTDAAECPSVTLPVAIDCNTCPNVTFSVSVGDCITQGQLAGCRPVTYAVTFGAGMSATDTAYVAITYSGTNVATGATNSGNLTQTGPGTLTHTAYLRAGNYASTASVTIVNQQGVALCLPPLPPLTFTTRPPTAPTPAVDVAGCFPCPQSVTVTVGNTMPPLPPPHVQLTAAVNWPTGAPAGVPSPVDYDWAITFPDNVTVATMPNGPAQVNTTTGWMGAGATAAGAVSFTQGGTYTVAATAKFAANAGLPVDPTTGLTACTLTGSTPLAMLGPCPQITGITPSAACADPTQSLSATINFTATVANLGNAVGPYQWDFGDSGSASNTASTATPTATHVYANPGNYTVTVSVGSPTGCPAAQFPQTFSIGQCACPAGQVRNAAGACVPSGGGGGGGGSTTPPSSFSWCCFLIYAWLILNTIFAVLLYYQVYSYWPVGTIIFIVVGALATIALVVWSLLCCRSCLGKSLSCCVFWQWQFIAASIVISLLGLLGTLCSWFPVLCGNGALIQLYSLYLSGVMAILSGGGCGRLPNPLAPATWPPCCCPGTTPCP